MQVNISVVNPSLSKEMWRYLTHPDNKTIWQMSMAGRSAISVIYFPKKEDAMFFKLKFGL